MALLTVQNLNISFGEKVILRNASFILNKGDKIGLTGANGCGKTSLLNVLSGENKNYGGNVIFSRDALPGYMRQHLFNDNKTLLQELLSVFSGLSRAEKELDDVTKKLKTNPVPELLARQEYLNEFLSRNGGLTYKSRTESALIGLGFKKEEFDMPSSSLSGGQRSKLALARVLLSKSNLLFLDEPTNHLDISGVRWLEDFLSSFSGSFIVVSHDRYFLDRVTNKTMEISGKKLFSYSGNYTAFTKKRHEAQKSIENKYKKDMLEIERLEGIIAQQRRWNREKNIKTAESKEKAVQRIKAELVVPESVLKQVKFNFSVKTRSGDDVLFARGLAKSFKSEAVFNNLGFEIKKGERVFLLGNNGCGKTTLFKILAGIYKPDSGSFKYGVNVKTGYFDQVQENLNLNNSVLQEVWNAYPSFTETKVRSALAAFNFTGDSVFRTLSKCSGGERAKVSLLKLMLGDYNFLLLDEPTNHLDAPSKDNLEDNLSSYDGTLFIISHDRYFINSIATRILCFEDGALKSYAGNYDFYFEHSKESPSKSGLSIKTQTSLKTHKPGENAAVYKNRKKAQSEIRRLRVSVSKIEEDIELTESEISKTEDLINSNPPYEKLLELNGRLEKLNSHRDELYERWETESEKLATLSS